MLHRGTAAWRASWWGHEGGDVTLNRGAIVQTEGRDIGEVTALHGHRCCSVRSRLAYVHVSLRPERT